MKSKRRIAALVNDRRGDMFVETLVKLVVVTVFLLSLVEFYAIFIKYQNVNFVARRMVRAIEVSGGTQGIGTMFSNISTQVKLNGATYTIEAVYCNGNGGIQLRDTFTVEVKYTYYFTVFSPNFSPPLRIPINMSAKFGGMSEVYHKT